MTKDKIKTAIKYATTAHLGQTRKGGKNIPYISHPIAVMNIVKSKGYGAEVQMASVLHDVVEDCEGYTLNDLSKSGSLIKPFQPTVVRGFSK